MLRAFELLTEREVTRPNIAGLMGAFGAALTARMHYEDIADDDNAHVGADGRSVDAAAAEESAAGDEPNAAAHAGEIVVDGVRHTVSSILTGEALNEMSMTTERDVCKLCQNHCKLTITTFSDGSRFVTGNRCERGGDARRNAPTVRTCTTTSTSVASPTAASPTRTPPEAKSASRAPSTCTRTTRSGSRCSPRWASR